MHVAPYSQFRVLEMLSVFQGVICVFASGHVLFLGLNLTLPGVFSVVQNP